MKTIKPIITHILKILAFLAVPLFVYLFIVNSSMAVIGTGIETYVASDEETNFLTALSVYRREGLYKNFSISYPPGRFIAQALFFHLTTPTVISARIYMNLFAPLLFPTLLFFLTYSFFRVLKLNFISAYLLGWLALLFDLTLVHSAQEVHVIIAAFCLVLLSHFRVRQLILGALLGLIFLFRFEAGIIVTLSLLISYRTLPSLRAITGFSLVWIPVLLNLLFSRTLGNFFYDTIILGLLTQPRVMGQSIPNNALWLVFLATLIVLLAFSISLWQKGNKSLKVVAAISLLSYVTALGRSDEGHLWYGLLWLPLVVSYAISLTNLNFMKKIRLMPLFIIGITVFSLSYFIIIIKEPSIFLLTSCLIFIFSSRFRSYFKEVALSGLIVALLVFHSFAYLTLRFQLPRFVGYLAIPSTSSLSENSIAGLSFPASTINSLSILKSKISGYSPSLFIFPENTLYYEYFHLPRPTRYTYLTGERTERTENEIILRLESTPNLYILVFPEKAIHRGGELLKWIENNSKLVSSVPYQDSIVSLFHTN